MNLVTDVSMLRSMFNKPQENFSLRIDSVPCSPEVIINNLSSLKGPVDVYCWYEGPQCLPQKGATFMRDNIFMPLYNLKPDAKLFLYSLKGWDFVERSNVSSTIGEAINRINLAAVECLYSASFFAYCRNVQDKPGLYQFLDKELQKKSGLIDLSKEKESKGLTLAMLFRDNSLFDSIKEMDVAKAYSLIQYVEGYYLIQESVRKGLENGQKKIQIAFVLPNDEAKYYQDYQKDIRNMLLSDFGDKINSVDIFITFQFFEYGITPSDRPYVDKSKNATTVLSREIPSYFNYLLPSQVLLRDKVHNINGWY